MSKVQQLRCSVKQRLTEAAEDIFVLFERTIAEYEEQLSRSTQENERQRKLLDAVLKPEVRLRRKDVQQQVPPQQQDWSPSVDQEQPEPPHIKEEQEEVWSSQEGEQLEGLEEADITKFPFSPVPVKTEDNEEKLQSSQLHQSQTEDNRDSDRGSEPNRTTGPDGQSGPAADSRTSDSLKRSDISLMNVGCDSGEKPFRCCECGRRFRHKGHLQIHMRCHTGEKPFSCSVCLKRFPRNENLVRHMRFHTGEKPFSCSFCQKLFTRSDHAVTHMRIHTGEKPFSCSVCGRNFRQKRSVKHHMQLHTDERPFSCTVCDKRFTKQSQVKSHRCSLDLSSVKAAGSGNGFISNSLHK